MSKKKKKSDLVAEACREFRCKLDRLFERAAEWARAAYGRRIRRGAIMEAIGKYRSRGIIPNWVADFIRQWRMARAIA